MTTGADDAARGLSIKRALALLSEMEARLNAAEQKRREPIAIVGVGCRFPGGADDADAYFRLLANGVDAITTVPEGRWDVDAYYDPDPSVPGKVGTRWGGFLEKVDTFDAAFFNLSPREVACMDPQQRLVLEVAWEALESAGLPEERLAASATGIFVGICGSDYSRARFTDEATIDAYTSTGNALSIVASRLAYHLDLRGPAVAVDTACSSSLVAVHLACQSLRAGECRQALAGGVHLMLSPETIISFTKWGMLSPDGRCKTFDARANGIVLGEGCGILVMKRLSDAIADRDPIVATIRGTAVNQDGKSAGITAPNPGAQRAVIRKALAEAGISPSDVGYIEAHGTGTSLGDPIELEALSEVYGEGRGPAGPCFVGSMKTNMGHLEAAAGVAGLIKAALVLKRKEIPPHLHFKALNPNVSLDPAAIAVPTERTPWPSGARPRRAAVSSFGFSGTNAHIVLEDAAEAATTSTGSAADDGVELILPLSARSRGALEASARALRDVLRAPPGSGAPLRDVSFSAGVRRTHFEHRLAVVGSSSEAMAEQLDAFLAGETRPRMSASAGAVPKRRKIAFVFSGHGSQWAEMGLSLAALEPVFRRALEACEEALKVSTDWSLLRELSAREPESKLDRVAIAQPSIFAVEVALAALFRSYGVEPDVVVGHSMGEIAAAHVAGILSLADAARIISRRSQLMQRTSGQGGMILVDSAPDQAEALTARYGGRVTIGAINGPRAVALSGDRAALAEILADLEGQGVFARWVKTDVAFHSAQMDPLREELVRLVRETAPSKGSIPLCSTVTGAPVRGEELDAVYWSRNLREPVAFWPAIRRLAEEGCDLFLEIAPHPVLSASMAQGLSHLRRQAVVVPSLRRGEGRAATLSAVGALYCAGAKIDFEKVQAGPGRVISLPKYAWQRERFWIETTTAPEARTRPGATRGHPLLGSPIHCAAVPGFHLFEGQADPARAAFFKDHCVDKKPVLPLSALLEAAIHCGASVLGVRSLEVEGFGAPRPVFLDSEPRSLQAAASADASGALALTIHAGDREGESPAWSLCARATVRRLEGGAGEPATEAIAAIEGRCPERVSSEEHYREVSARGITLGASFQGVEWIKRGDREALGRVQIPKKLRGGEGAFVVHPAFLDACLQVLGAALAAPSSPYRREDAFLPFYIDRLRVLGDSRRAAWSHAKLRATDAEEDLGSCAGDIIVYDEEGRALVEINGLQARRADRARPKRRGASDPSFYEISWQPAERAPAVAPARGSGAWLLLADRTGAADALRERLERLGEACILARPSDAYRHVGGGDYEINLERPAHFKRLLEDAFGHGRGQCRYIVHLAGLDAPPLDALDHASVRAAWKPASLSAIYLVQALASAGFRDPPRLWLVTRGAQSVNVGSAGGAREPVSPLQTMLWGMGRAIAHEHGELRASLVDIEADSGVSAAEALFAEIQADGPEDQVALRGDRRFVARLSSALEEPPPAPPEGVVRPDATYLLTGGLGGIGLVLARWLVDNGARSLILVGRSGASEAAEQAVSGFRAAGARVLVERADISREQDVRRVLGEISAAGLPPLRGVIHAAGALADGTLPRLDEAKLEAVMAPKVEGAFHLHRLTQGADLDFFVLLSSIASLLGSPGQANYSAANAFLDGLAEHRRALGLPALSINWGGWTDVGMAHRGGQGARLGVRGMKSFSPDGGPGGFARAPAHRGASVAFMAFDLRQWRQFYPKVADAPLLSLLLREKSETDGAPAGDIRRAIEGAPPGLERRALLESHVREGVASVLGLSPSRLDAASDLAAFNLDSLMALEIRNRLETTLDVSLSAALIFTHRTLGSLIDDVAKRMGILELPEHGEGGEGALEGVDVEALEKALAEVEQLSDEEARRMLEAERSIQ
jgi:acyl transferase domain-containing protein/acyl carrier protein